MSQKNALCTKRAFFKLHTTVKNTPVMIFNKDGASFKSFHLKEWGYRSLKAMGTKDYIFRGDEQDDY